MLKKILALIFCLALSSPISAAPIYYDEDVDGDIVSGVGGPPTVLLLDIGTNIIRGNVTNPGGCCEPSDFDKFNASFPGSVLIEEISIAIDSFSVHYPSWFEYQLDLGGTIFSTDIVADGLYEIAVGEVRDSFFYIGLNSFPDDVNADYEIMITASAVPIPATAWLFGSALLGLTGIARKKSG